MQKHENDEYIKKNKILTAKEKETKIKNILNKFYNIKSLKEAKELIKNLFHTEKRLCKINAGNGECIIVNRENLVRITYNSPLEFISFNFQ